MDWNIIKDVGEFGVGAAAGMGIYLGALRARLNVLRDELRLTREDVAKVGKRVTLLHRRVQNLPCQRVECRNEQKTEPDRNLGGNR